MDTADLTLTGARVIDPESGLDAVCDVGVTDGAISYVGTKPPPSRTVVDVRGLVLAPGFIDLHSHAQSVVGSRLQALDGVTSALDLEAGRSSVQRSIALAAEEGRPLNFGFSAGWAATRVRMVSAIEGEADPVIPTLDGWDAPWDDASVGRMTEALADQLQQGAIGIGVLLGYAPGVTRAEYLALARLAQDFNVPTFTHTRYISHEEPHSSLEGMLEVVAAAAGTGAHMHVCHLNSTSNRQIDEVTSVIERARAQGISITTEAYPYGSGATSIGAAFLAPDKLRRMGMTPSSITHLRTGGPVRDAAELARLRAEDPDAPVITQWADESLETDRAILQRSLLFEDTAIATDSFSPVRAGVEIPGQEWPLATGAVTHPRSLGCYAKVFRWLVRELDVLTLPEAIRRCSLIPAQILGEAVPAMRRKGRIQVGCDADLVVFDPETFTDRATYTEPVPSYGVRQLLVGGTFVLRDGELDPGAMPGRPIVSAVAGSDQD